MENFIRPSRFRKAWVLSPIKFAAELTVLIAGAAIYLGFKWYFNHTFWESFDWRELELTAGSAIAAAILYPTSRFIWNFIRACRLIAEEEAEYYRKLAIGFSEEVATLREQLEPRVAIEFDRQGSCEYHYGAKLQGQDVLAVLFRIRIRNLSQVKTAEGLEVILEATKPGFFDYLPVHFHQMHDRWEANDKQLKEFDLNAGALKYIDVVSKHSSQIGSCTLHQIDVDRPIGLPLGIPVKLTISVTGKNMPKVTETFAVYEEAVQQSLKFALWSAYEIGTIAPKEKMMAEIKELISSISKEQASASLSDTGINEP